MTEFIPASSSLDRTIAEGAPSVTIACVSSVSNEEGGIVITGSTTIEDIVNAYAQQFPKEASVYLAKTRAERAALRHSSGMSTGGRLMKLAEIPEFILWAARAIRRDYWDEPARTYRFIRSFPAFMVGDHRKKETKGVRVK